MSTVYEQPVDEGEYAICQRRGHDDSGYGITQGDTTWSVCRWCRTHYTFTEPRMIERDDDEGAWSWDNDAVLTPINDAILAVPTITTRAGIADTETPAE